MEAKITGTGSRSCCPDCPEAVDADLFVEGERIGGCTLVPPEDTRSSRRVDTWGDLSHWACPTLIKWIDAQDDRTDSIDSIVDAVESVLE